MKEIIINSKKYGQKVILVDDDYFNIVSKHIWHVIKGKHTFYAVTNIMTEKGKRSLSMHSLIMKTPIGNETDHKNGNGLDNRCENLRIVDNQQNHLNQRKTRGSSRFKGVYWHEMSKKWQSQIVVNGKPIALGLFSDEIQAAKMYDFWAMDIFGDFARTNFNVSFVHA